MRGFTKGLEKVFNELSGLILKGNYSVGSFGGLWGFYKASRRYRDLL